MIDCFMKMVYFVPCSKFIISKETTKLSLYKIYCYHGLLRDIMLDRWIQICIKILKNLFKFL